MEKPFDYPVEGWISHSRSRVAKLATDIHMDLQDHGVVAELLNAHYPSVVGWDKCIQSTGFNIRLTETDYGCQLQIYVFKEDGSALSFLSYWKSLVDNKRAWGGPYKKGNGGSIISEEKIAKEDLPKPEMEPSTTKDAAPKSKRRRKSHDRQKFEDIICDVLEATNEVEEHLLEYTASEVAAKLSPKYEAEDVFNFLMKFAEKRKKPIVPGELLKIRDLGYSSRTFRKWREERSGP